MKYSALLLTFFSFYLTTCMVMDNKYSAVAPGTWRAVLKLDPKEKPLKTHSAKLDSDPNGKFEEITQGELPFTFDVVYDDATMTKFHIEIINATERIRVDDIQIGRDRRTGRDTIRINFPAYESYIIGAYQGSVMDGKWVVPTKKDYSIPFTAKHAQNYRFTMLQKEPTVDLNGKWATTFGTDGKAEDQEKAIGEFQQKGNYLTGTFMTETGDYRYLEGTVQKDKFYLSCFDGSHAFLFEGKALQSGNLIGLFRSGHRYEAAWEATKDNKATLRDANTINTVKAGQEKIDFSFNNPRGKTISLANPDYAGKVKIIQLMGTWCPNCYDESNFLTQYLKENPTLPVAVIGLAFERHQNKADADKQLAIYKEKRNIPYEMVVAGYADKQEPAKVIPALTGFSAFPTMLYVDKNNHIRRVHTGFSGPATSNYEAFKKEFDAFVKELIKE
jgi:thiol-disulfide isomerase/thioredoxin